MRHFPAIKKADGEGRRWKVENSFFERSASRQASCKSPQGTHLPMVGQLRMRILNLSATHQFSSIQLKKRTLKKFWRQGLQRQEVFFIKKKLKHTWARPETVAALKWAQLAHFIQLIKGTMGRVIYLVLLKVYTWARVIWRGKFGIGGYKVSFR